MPPILNIWFKQNLWRGVSGVLAVVLLIQFAGFVSMFAGAVDPRSLLSARDADGSHIVGTADRTRWYKDNGESAYGAFYYRAAQTLNVLAGRDYAEPGSPTENRERAQHLTLMTLSLICLFAIAYLLAGQISVVPAARLCLTASLAAVFLNDPIWATFIFRPHPDLPLALALLVAFLASARLLQNPEDRLCFYLAALAWGVTGMIKLTFVIFVAAVPILFMPPFNRTSLRRVFRFYAWMLPTYVILGFPQSLNFPRSIKFLRTQSGYNLAPTWDSVADWLRNLELQAFWPVIIVLGLSLLRTAPTRYGRARLAVLVMFPLAVVLRQNNGIEARYYLIPIITLGLAWLALSVRRPAFSRLVKSGLKLNLFLDRVFLIAPFALLITVVSTIGLVPRRMEAEITPTLTCRADTQKVYSAIHAEIERGRLFVLDPYVPFDRARAGDKAFGGWSNDWSTVAEHGATGLVINVGIARTFVPGPPAHSVQVDSPNWRAMTAFYHDLLDQDRVRDPAGKTWRKEFETGCGQAVWLQISEP